ncbi:MAG: CPBP family intramembrane glutamic endopeptidase [Bacteroidota bacterium]
MTTRELIEDSVKKYGFMFFGLFILLSVSIGTGIGELLSKIIFKNTFNMQNVSLLASNHDACNYMKFSQAVGAISLFIIAPIVLGLFNRELMKSWGFNNKINVKLLYFLPLTMILAIPFINFTAMINEMMKMPSFLSGIEKWMLQSEADNKILTDAFLSSITIKGLLLNVFIMAVIPAIGEELFFRGAIQSLFQKFIKNHHIAIFLTAFLFSAIHMQFYGFIPRFLMGLFFGYLFYWSKSLWLPILAHFTNNFVAVIFTYLGNAKAVTSAPENIGSSGNDWIGILISILLTGFLIFYIWRNIQDENRTIRH